MSDSLNDDIKKLFSPRRPAIGTIAKVGIVIVVIFGGLIGLAATVGPKASTSTSTTTATGTSTTTVAATPTATATATSTVSSPPSVSASSATSTTTSAVSSSTGPLAIAISLAISDPPDAKASSSVYIYDVTVLNNGQTSYPIDDSYFMLISNSNTVYNPTSVGAIQRSLPTLNLAQGQKATGQVAFQIPTSETPAQLEYHIPLSIDEFVTNLPAPSSFVSEPNFEITTNVQGPTDEFGLQELDATSSIQNSTSLGYFYTGQTMAIKVSLSNLDTTGSSGAPGTTVKVNSITSNTTGLSISQISPSLPVTVVGGNGGGEVEVMVYMVAPAGSFTGTISLNVMATG